MLNEALRPEVQFGLQSLLIYGPPLLGMAFRLSQRKAIIQRDQSVGIKLEGNLNGCQWPYKHKCSGKIHVHHVLPEMYQRTLGIPNPDLPDVALSICSNIHIGEEGQKQHGPHPDQPKYLADYRKGDKKAFERMQKDRKDKLTERQPYDDQTHFREMLVLARRNTQKMEIKFPKWMNIFKNEKK